MSRRSWLLPGRRQTIVLAVLILGAGASLLLLPERSSSYRAVATVVPPEDAPACVQDAPEHVAGEDLRGLVVARTQMPLRDVAGATEVLPAPPGAVLSVAFEADTAYTAQRGAFTTAFQSAGDACADEAARLYVDYGQTLARLDAAEEALRAATAFAAPARPPASLVARRNEAAAAVMEAKAEFAAFSEMLAQSTSVGAAEARGTERSTLEDLAVPGGVALCAVLALIVLRTGWRRAAGPVPA